MAYDDDFDDAEDTMKMRPISVPDPALPGSSNAAARSSAQRGQRAQGSQGVDDETRIISPVGDETRVINMPSVSGRAAQSSEQAGDLRGLQSGAFQDEDEDEGEYGLTATQKAEKKKAAKAKKKLIAIVTIVVIAILAIGGVLGWWLWRRMATNSALVSCHNASLSLEQASKDFASARNASATQQALTATSSQVVNGELISSLHNTTARSVPKPVSCSVDLGFTKLDKNAEKMMKDAASLRKATDTIKSDTKAITASRTAKQISDARQSLTQLISSAQEVASNQTGRVQDSSTISELLSRLNQASQGISSAVEAVNSSALAKTKADEEQQRKEEQQKSQNTGDTDSDSQDSRSSSTDGSNSGNQQNQGAQGGQNGQGQQQGQANQNGQNNGGQQNQ